MSGSLDPDDSPVLTRLLALLARGYEVDAAMSRADGQSLHLEHPARKRCRYWSVALDPSGRVRGWATSKQDTADYVRIRAEEAESFSDFIRKVPHPTLWEKHWRARYTVFSVVFFVGFASIGGAVLNWVWDFFTRSP